MSHPSHVPPDDVLDWARSLVFRHAVLEIAALRTAVTGRVHSDAVSDGSDHGRSGVTRGAKDGGACLRGSVVLGPTSAAVDGSTVGNIRYTPIRNDDHMVSLAGAAITNRNPELSDQRTDALFEMIASRTEVA